MACDTNYSDVVILLHLDGPNGGTTFTDSSPAPNTFNASGGADLTTSNPAFGTASLNIGALSSSTNDFIATPAATHGPLDIFSAAVDFTIEGQYMAPVAGNSNSVTFDYQGSTVDSGIVLTVNPSSGVLDVVQSNNMFFAGWPSLTATVGALSGGTWYHFAVERKGSNGYLYWNGTLVASTIGHWAGTPSPPTGTNRVSLGWSVAISGGMEPCQLDEFRVTIGLARYTSNFTPPSSAFGGACGPSISTQPQDVSVEAPFSATFSVTASSSGGPLTYQWYVNGVSIPGATSSTYVIDPTSEALNGNSYTVYVSDNNGSLLSNAAVLTITGVRGGTAYGKFVGAPPVFKAVEIANIGDIEPKVWHPYSISTVRSRS